MNGTLRVCLTKDFDIELFMFVTLRTLKRDSTCQSYTEDTEVGLCVSVILEDSEIRLCQSVS